MQKKIENNVYHDMIAWLPKNSKRFMNKYENMDTDLYKLTTWHFADSVVEVFNIWSWQETNNTLRIIIFQNWCGF